MASFPGQVLGLDLVHQETGFSVFALPDRRHVEVLAPSHPKKEHFDTGPWSALGSRTLASAVAELERAGIELVGELGPTWQHLPAPDGNIYELVAE
jgi:hypothetical protein